MTGQTMRAGVASADGLTLRDVPVPEPTAGQLLVKVSAAGMNRADLNAARGAGVASCESHGKAIGMEWAGEVVDLGGPDSGFAVGDRVTCSGSGGYAEYAVADAARTFDVPSDMSYAEAAALPLALMTAHDALVREGGFTTDQTILVHGASSCVGLATIAIARLMGASRILGTSTRPNRLARLAASGVTAIDPSNADWPQAVHDATDGRGADVVVDMVTGPGINDTMRATAIHGRIVNVGRLAGTRADFDLDLHALRRLSLVGVTFRSRTPDEVRTIVRDVDRHLWPHVRSGALRLPMDREFDLEDAVAAHAYMLANHHFGKIMLTIGDTSAD